MKPRSPAASAQTGALREVMASCSHAFVAIAVFSALINVLYLTGSFYMLEVYDRVLPGRSVPTLIALSALALLLYLFQGILDVIRSRLFVRIAARLDERLSARVYDIVIKMPLRPRQQVDALAPIRDLDTIRSFLTTTGPLALFDLPWMPFYILLCFVFHFWIGVAALIGALILASLTLISEILTRQPSRLAAQHSSQRNNLADSARRNAEVLQAMGMAPQMTETWSQSNAEYLKAQQRTSDIAGGLGAISKVLRFVLQSGVLGLGAYLVINQQATGGVILAGSIVVARALAPVELAIANWKGFVAARLSWARLTETLAREPEPAHTDLPKPVEHMIVENVSGGPPNSQKITIQDVNFGLLAGQGLGIIGPSASGKSSLARLLVGVWTPARGKVRLDGAALDQWFPAALGRNIGYLPQDVELFSGTVSQNIARFNRDATADVVIAAAKAAGVHDMIVRLADGYETQIGDGGMSLSAGQRQRIGLARALYGDPFLVVLDEPNSNLDNDGDKALAQAILGVRQRGGIVVVIAHRQSALAGVDLVLAMMNGRMSMMGPRDEVMARLFGPDQRRGTPAASAETSGERPGAKAASEGERVSS